MAGALMDSQRHWSDFFARWPAGMARKGVLVTNFGEQVTFVGFLASPELLLIERQAPDTTGARKVVLPYSNVLAVKITEIVKPTVFQELGFQGTLPAL